MQAEAIPLPVIRSCDGCTLCCKVMGVKALDKPQGKWCQHCRIGSGCGIYETRPAECIDFNCGYLVLPHLTPEWKPAVCHLIVASGISRDRTNVHVDPSRPDSWRKQPYYATMKEWARQGLAKRQQVVVMIGQRSIVLLPDRDLDFGEVKLDEVIVIGERPGINGMEYDAFVVRRDTTVAENLGAAHGKPIPIPTSGEGMRHGRVVA